MDVISAEEGALRRGAEAVNTAKAGIHQQVRKVRGDIDQRRTKTPTSATNSRQRQIADSEDNDRMVELR